MPKNDPQTTLSTMKKNTLARHYEPLPGGAVACRLCPHHCVIQRGGRGRCQVRLNRDGELFSLVYGHPSALQIDPIEKKPLAFWKSGSRTFSLGTLGCNMSCAYCQNHTLSRALPDDTRPRLWLEPAQIVAMAKENGCESIAFTYNEPTVFQEYAVDIAKEARKVGLATVLVSNGWIDPEPRQEIYALIDAANIDIKGFSDDFYKTLCGASLEVVLQSCRHLRRVSGSHLELTNLVIPGYNDDEKMLNALLDWTADELGKDTPIHFSAYFPAAGFSAPPTPPQTLYRIRDIATKKGFTRVRLGNLH